MTITQHAEAAADEIDRSMTDGPKAIIAKHMQAAIDEAIAPLRARIAELEQHYLDRCRDHAICNARIAALEDMGPLIDDYIAEVNRLFYLEDQSGEMLDLSLKIKTILKGGAS